MPSIRSLLGCFGEQHTNLLLLPNWPCDITHQVPDLLLGLLNIGVEDKRDDKTCNKKQCNCKKTKTKDKESVHAILKACRSGFGVGIAVLLYNHLTIKLSGNNSEDNVTVS